MKRIRLLAIFAVLGLSATMPALSQSSQSDSQTLQAILSELRGMHDDMRLTAISEILLAELQTQQTVVNAATGRVNTAGQQLADLRAEEKRVSAALASSQDKLTDSSDTTQAKELSEAADQLKSALAALKAREDGVSTSLQTAESQLRSAQDTLDDIQQRLDTTVKKLQPLALH